MGRSFHIGTCAIGIGKPTFIIAEAGINHNGDSELAFLMIDKAAQAGADAVKFQTYKTEDLVAKGNPYYEIFRGAEISEIGILQELKSHAKKKGILFFSSASTESGLDILQSLSVPLVKLSSANLTNLPLLARVAKMKVPVIISSGAATLAEVLRGVEFLQEHGAHDIAVLKCTAIYPCPPEHANLGGIKTLMGSFDGPVGFSDHTEGPFAAAAAVALGACVVEKHFTLDKSMEGHDHHFSCNPTELTELVNAIRSIEKMKGSSRIEPVGEEIEFRAIGRRSVTAIRDIAANETIDSSMVTPRRPKDGPGIESEHIEIVIGRPAKQFISQGCSIKWADI
jgi:N,N'-diacetyllegionaminate synthase